MKTPPPPALDGGGASGERDSHIVELAAKLREAEETLEAIRNGDVDAVVVGGPSGQQVYTLENADRPYRVLIEQMHEGAVSFSETGTILYCNERFSAMVEVQREAIIGGTLTRFMVAAECDVFLDLVAKTIGSSASGEFTLHAANGSEVPVNISLVDLEVDDGLRVVCAIVTDLTNSRSRTNELVAANRLLATEIEERSRAEISLQLALDAAGMASWELDLASGVARRSLRHDQIFGYPQMLPVWSFQMALEHFVAEDREQVAHAFAAAATTGFVDLQARICRANDGKVRWLHVKGQTFYETSQPVRIAGIVVDVTDRLAVEEQLRQTQKIEAIGQLTGGVAHDFNNLLMVMSGGVDLLAGSPTPERRDQILSGMRHAVERGTSLSRHLLTFSRRQSLRPEPIDLRRQVGQMKDLLDRSLRGDVNVVTWFSSDLWPVEVDSGELELVILNLAVNARDAMPDGGTVNIRGENAPMLEDSKLSGDFVRLSVTDTGTGISPEVLAHVFEPYFTTKDIGKGSGLGLAHTFGFAQASGGDVRIESAPGAGTTISLLLPRTLKVPAAAENRSAAVPGVRPASGSAGDVLLVEDDDEVAALTAEMIQQLGYATTRVATAQSALGALANGRPIDIVFSDVMMPGEMNGIDLACEIRRRYPGLPIVLTSGYVEAAKRGAEVDDIKLLSKPYRLEDLGHAFASARRQ